ncbi:MAG: O-methyltransferase [Bacteroidota bacterium]
MINKKIEEYAEEHSSPEDDVLYDLNRKTHLNVVRPKMLSGHLQGRLLQMISEMLKPQRILEIGTYTGYSTICLGRGLAGDGKIITIEKNPELESMVRSYIAKAGLKDKTTLEIGDAMEILPRLDDRFDLAFIDADKENYIAYYDIIKPKIRKGGYILADNALWYGKVVDPTKHTDSETTGITAFNEYVQEDTDVENLLLPFRDGIMIMKKLV